MYKVFYGVVYKSLIEKDHNFLKLIQMLKDGIGLNLTNADDEFMNNLKNVLLETIK